MGIRHEGDAQIIRNAITLECSEMAQNAQLLYRGAQHQKDSPVFVRSSDNKPLPSSLSYGTGLFAGALYDGYATAFYYMRADSNQAFALVVPFDQLKESPFYVPEDNAIVQLCSNGESFHGRTKI